MSKLNLAAITTETQVKLSIKTEVKLLKKDADKNPNDLGKVFKIATVIGTVNKRYEDAVNEQRLEEGKAADFVSSGRNWGTKEGCIITHENGTKYLEYFEESKVGQIFQREDGTAIDPKTFQRFVSTAAKGKLQDVDNPVKVRTVTLSNVLYATVV